MTEPPVDEQLRYVLDGAVARITIDRPDTGNSLTPALRDRLTERFEAASPDQRVRAVILTGAGERHFCTGANLGGAQPPGPPRPEGAPERAWGETARIIRRGWQRLVASILDCEKPVIAAVNGTAAGGGAQLVLASDLVVMAESARVIEVFVRRGIIPDAGGAYLLPRLVGLQRAKELLFFGDDVDAAAALRLGLATTVVPAGEVGAAATALAERLCTLPTKALTATKWLLNRSFESSRHTAFEEEAMAQELVAASDDAREGLRAFAERREPRFRGW